MQAVIPDSNHLLVVTCNLHNRGGLYHQSFQPRQSLQVTSKVYQLSRSAASFYFCGEYITLTCDLVSCYTSF